MQSIEIEYLSWANEELDGVQLGDSRRVRRVAGMLARGAERPNGRLTDVFIKPAERQGAYDLLEEGHVKYEALISSFASATCRRTSKQPWLFAVIDGSSIQLTDLTFDRGLGTLGSLTHGARGLKVITALGVEPNGVSAGLLGQVWWARKNAQRDARNKRQINAKKSLEEKETRHWLVAINEAQAAADREGKQLWYQLDREGDNQDILLALETTNHKWTVRGARDRLIEIGTNEFHIRSYLSEQAAIGHYEVAINGRSKRKVRTARMQVRSARVMLLLRQQNKGVARRLEVNVVWAVEDGTTPNDETPIDWLLLTNHHVENFTDACEVIYGYTQRWRIEEFHRAWKSSVCRVEDTQLRSAQAIEVWATLLANVAVRVERLRLLSRQYGDDEASIEFNPQEIRALILIKRRRAACNEIIPDSMPTLSQAVRWIADLGGYTGKSSGGPPGATTIRRGLELLRPAIEMMEILDPEK
jgi:hypothetical protein